jgi:hypothetical protein
LPEPNSVQAATLLALLALHVVLSAVIMVASALVALRLGARRPVLLVAAAFAGWAVTGYAAVFVYLSQPAAGPVYSDAVLALGVVICAVLGWRLGETQRSALRLLIRPALLTCLTVVFVTTLGFMFGNIAHPTDVPTIRFSDSTSRLPSDNAIPFFFAQALYDHRRPIPSPLFADWLSSDRPPLQTGLTLVQMPLFVWGSTPYLQYQLVSVVAQSVWILGLWVWLNESRVRGVPAALVLGTTLATGFALLNTFYVWPKMLAAAFLLVIAAIVLTRAEGHFLAAGAATGLMAGFSLLSHEGSVFALAAMALLLAIRRRIPSPRFIAAAAVSLLLTMAPWWWYQKFYDPPGDRLLKYHLANHPELTKDGFLSLFASSYEHLGLGGAVGYKLRNLAQLAGDPSALAHDFGTLIANVFRVPGTGAEQLFVSAAHVRYDVFFGFFPGLGVMLLGPVALLLAWIRHRDRGLAVELAPALSAWSFVALTLVIWCLVMFGPAATVPHQGTYIAELLAMAGSMLAFWALSHRVALIAAGLQLALNLFLYVVLTPEPGPYRTMYMSGFNPYLAIAALLSAAALVLVLAAAARSDTLNKT